MEIYRIGEFQSHPGRGKALLDLLEKTFIPMIEAADGWLGYQMFQRQDEPEKIMIIERWETAQAHQASVKVIPPEALDEVRGLLAVPPAGGYYLLAKENRRTRGGVR